MGRPAEALQHDHRTAMTLEAPQPFTVDAFDRLLVRPVEPDAEAAAQRLLTMRSRARSAIPLASAMTTP